MLKVTGLGYSLMGTWTLRRACVALRNSHPIWFTQNDLRAMSFVHGVRENFMCLIMLILLRVATSESMIPRPCFLPFALSFATCYLATIFITELLHLVFHSILHHFHYLLAELVHYTTDNCIRCVEDAREPSCQLRHYFLVPFITNLFY